MNRERGIFQIPEELEAGLWTFGITLFPGLPAIPMDEGVSVAIFHFDKAVKVAAEPSRDSNTFIASIINILKALWLTRAVQGGQDYQVATACYLLNPVEQQLDRWGISVGRFFAEFEQVILQALSLYVVLLTHDFEYQILQDALTNLVGHHMLLPPVSDLIEALDRSLESTGHERPHSTPNTTSEQNFGSKSSLRTIYAPEFELGTRVLSSDLMSQDPGYATTLQLFRQTDKRFSLVTLRSALGVGRDRETT